MSSLLSTALKCPLIFSTPSMCLDFFFHPWTESTGEGGKNASKNLQMTWSKEAGVKNKQLSSASKHISNSQAPLINRWEQILFEQKGCLIQELISASRTGQDCEILPLQAALCCTLHVAMTWHQCLIKERIAFPAAEYVLLLLLLVIVAYADWELTAHQSLIWGLHFWCCEAC